VARDQHVAVAVSRVRREGNRMERNMTPDDARAVVLTLWRSDGGVWVERADGSPTILPDGAWTKYRALLRYDHDALVAEVAALTKERDAALTLLAMWCLAVERDSSWDGWDHHYKNSRREDRRDPQGGRMSGITHARVECIEHGCQMIEGAPYHKMLEMARAEVAALKQERDAMREALVFYADTTRYCKDIDCRGNVTGPDVILDHGARAREALDAAKARGATT